MMHVGGFGSLIRALPSIAHIRWRPHVCVYAQINVYISISYGATGINFMPLPHPGPLPLGHVREASDLRSGRSVGRRWREFWTICQQTKNPGRRKGRRQRTQDGLKAPWKACPNAITQERLEGQSRALCEHCTVMAVKGMDVAHKRAPGWKLKPRSHGPQTSTETHAFASFLFILPRVMIPPLYPRYDSNIFTSEQNDFVSLSEVELYLAFAATAMLIYDAGSLVQLSFP